MLKPGAIFRLPGPTGWIKIERLVMPGEAHDDGGAPGVVMQSSEFLPLTYKTGRLRWKKWFCLAKDREDFIRRRLSHRPYTPTNSDRWSPLDKDTP